jgi:hypothetical protein
MRVEIDLPNDDEKLLPGMYAQVSFGPVLAATEAPVVGRAFLADRFSNGNQGASGGSTSPK